MTVSGIAKVELGVRMTGAPNFTWQTAPPCQDAFGEAVDVDLEPKKVEE